MRFERHVDPRQSMDIGLIQTAPIVYRLLWDHEREQNGNPGEHVVKIPDHDTLRLLGKMKDYPQSVHNYYVDFIDKDGKVFSGLEPLSNYAGEHVQYNGKLFLIPEV